MILIKGLIVGITGAPGAGKSYFAERLAARLKADIIEINDIASRNNAFSGKDKDGTRIVNMKTLQKAMTSELKSRKGKNVVVAGHLLQELDLPLDLVVVIRIGIKKLERRLKSRSYGRNKLKENLVSEATDYCGSVAISKYKKVFEVETDAEKKAVIRILSTKTPDFKRLAFLEASKNQKNKMQEFLILIKSNKKLGF